MIIYIVSRDPHYISGDCSIDSVYSSFEKVLKSFPEETFVEDKGKYKKWVNDGLHDAYLEITEHQIDPVWDENKEEYIYETH